jgi:pimeloyl-ACP methyl ester carboxylesterase
VRLTVAGQEIDFELNGDGRTLVFVHGLTADRRLLVEAFEPVFAERPGFRRLYLDLPGHGASNADLAWASADGLVRAVNEIVASVAGPLPALVGHQYGAYLALGVTRETQLGGLFLVNPIVEPDLGLRTLPAQRVIARDEALEFIDDDERYTFGAEVVEQTAPVLERFRRTVDAAHRVTDREFLTAVRARYALSTTWTPGVQTVEGPVSVVCSRDDHWTGYSDALAIVRAHQRCHFTVLPDGGPYLPLERGEALRELFAGWLGSFDR